ncbi:uncharacterized protein LTR77_005806 [Saxophila tyrrhenica]|uniref:S-adenosyl-L-methionine-dependent methyltransferase n=1 Tax=Saxophila tyrrhenica TaxID=1690608 RepID=A0AAV9P9Y6_9PEZI|nr:hypothetical protein LTR77_005806 [Saxophila tyrrhenica]
MPRVPRPHHVASTAQRATTRPPPPIQPSIQQQHFKPNRAPTPTPPLQDSITTKDAPPNPYKSRALPWAFATLLAAGLGFYTTRLVIELRKPCINPEISLLTHQRDVSARYEDTADAFDSEVGISETLMGINSLRKELARKCQGHVLEASCGTGRNLGYFDVGPQGRVESLTFVDLSPRMVELCMKKWVILHGTEMPSANLKRGLKVRFRKGSVISSIPDVPVEGEEEGKRGYDTILQTMGLCSTPEPVELLRSLAAHLDTGNPDARILLLEHGRGDREWVNRVLDNAAEKHAEIHGCWFNRDIGALVEEAAKGAGLEVVEGRRRHFGTTWVFELKAGERLRREGNSKQGEQRPNEVKEATSWASWLGWK